MSNVLYVVPTAGIGGAETFVRHTAQFHERYKPIYCLLRRGELEDWLIKENFPCFVSDPLPRLRNPIDILKTIRFIRKKAIEYDAPIIHSTMAYGALFGAPAASACRRKHVWYQHGPASGWMDRAAGVLKSDRIFVNSEFTRSRQLQLEGSLKSLIPKSRLIDLLELGVDILETQPFRQELMQQMNIGDETVIFAMLCRPQDWKGIHLFVEALAIAKQKIRSDIAAVFWGGNNDSPNSYEKSVRALAEKNKVNLFFAGMIDRPLDALASIDVLVNASVIPEPFGLSIIEAMAVGATPLVPNEGGPVEIVDSGVDGLHFEARSAADLAEKIISLAQNRDNVSKMGEKAKEKALKKYNAKRTIAELEDKYDEILS